MNTETKIFSRHVPIQQYTGHLRHLYQDFTKVQLIYKAESCKIPLHCRVRLIAHTLIIDHTQGESAISDWILFPHPLRSNCWFLWVTSFSFILKTLDKRFQIRASVLSFFPWSVKERLLQHVARLGLLGGSAYRQGFHIRPSCGMSNWMASLCCM